MPYISILIPTYNDPESLPETLRTVLFQDFSDFEVIVVNDGGSSPENYAELSDNRVRLIELEKNGGVSAARNRALVEAKGEIVYFLDADDLIASDTLSFVARVMQNPEISILSVGHSPLPSSKVATNNHLLESNKRNFHLEKHSPSEFYLLCRYRTGLFIPSAMFLRKKTLLQIAGEAPWNTEISNSEDTLLFLMLAHKYSVYRSDEILVIYRLQQQSLSHNYKKAWNGRITAMDILWDWLVVQNADPIFLQTAKAMRQNAARRTARLLSASGEKTGARQLLYEDILKCFNWKSAVELSRHLF